jgi:hypothetical protein
LPPRPPPGGGPLDRHDLKARRRGRTRRTVGSGMDAPSSLPSNRGGLGGHPPAGSRGRAPGLRSVQHKPLRRRLTWRRRRLRDQKSRPVVKSAGKARPERNTRMRPGQPNREPLWIHSSESIAISPALACSGVRAARMAPLQGSTQMAPATRWAVLPCCQRKPICQAVLWPSPARVAAQAGQRGAQAVPRPPEPYAAGGHDQQEKAEHADDLLAAPGGE